MRYVFLLSGAALGMALGISMQAEAAEKITYTYDAKGRLVKVVHSCTPAAPCPNNGVQTTYQHDKADNRSNVRTTGATN
ncbi:MAG: hypothetical protein ACRDGM_14045 [bacterium]